MDNLSNEAKEIEKTVLGGRYKPAPVSKWGRYRNAAKETNYKIARINIIY